jgi:hypothetical protein
MRLRPRFASLSAALLLLACDSSQDLGENGQNANASGSSGSSGSSGASGSSGSSGVAGAASGASGGGGASGSSGSSQAGASGSSGSSQAGAGGSSGSSQAGASGSSGSSQAGASGSSGSSQAGAGGSVTAECPETGSASTETFAAAGGTPVALVATSDALYWSANDGEGATGSIQRLDRTTKLTTVVVSAANDPQAPASAFTAVDSFAITADHVIWRTNQGREIWSAPLAGGAGTSTPIYQSAQATAFSVPSYASNPSASLVVSSTHAYFTEFFGDGSEQRAAIEAVPLAGGAPTVLFQFVGAPPGSGVNTEARFPLDLAFDGSSLFFTRASWDAPMFAQEGGVYRVSIDAPTPTEIQPGIGYRLAVDATSLFYASTTPAVFAREKAGSTQKLLLPPAPTDASVLTALAQAGSSVYLATAGSYLDSQTGGLASGCGWVRAVDKAGGSPESVVWSGPGRPFAVQADGAGVYWLDSENNTVVWRFTAGGPPT